MYNQSPLLSAVFPVASIIKFFLPSFDFPSKTSAKFLLSVFVTFAPTISAIEANKSI
ncbi:hypothetical protein [Polaribacter marinivivus]|uniref:Uncharacterized protein n=1 Tax=Polaribacter marinivivus TaxID=1524260 RepID=A0ABV8RA26_9FLAO